jgi:dienelactone hydrolase
MKWFAFCFFACSCLLGFGQEPSWIPEASVIPDDATKLLGQPLPKFSRVADWNVERESIRKRWNDYLGGFDEHRTTNKPKPTIEWLESVHCEPGLVRSLIRYETEPGQWVEAYVLGPGSNEPLRPGVVVFHSTVNHSIDQCVGLGDPSKGSTSPNEDELRKAYALHLARRGFVTLSPRNFLWPQRVGIAAEKQAKAFLERNPRRKGMARMLLDAQCSVDVLQSLDGVDAKRLGAIGHSLGAKEVLYLGAFDERVRAIVSSEGGLAREQSNWDADWYLGKDNESSRWDANHHELVALIAPRAFLLIGGEASDGTASVPYLQNAAGVFALFDARRSLAFLNHRQGHKVTDETLRQSIEWLEWHLK